MRNRFVYNALPIGLLFLGAWGNAMEADHEPESPEETLKRKQTFKTAYRASNNGIRGDIREAFVQALPKNEREAYIKLIQQEGRKIEEDPMPELNQSQEHEYQEEAPRIRQGAGKVKSSQRRKSWGG